jgi:putative PIN family toxin of toxin-antitoxin system
VRGPCVAPNRILRVVLDTCILKLATFPARDNASALVFELARSGLIEAWASPAILEEYADVLGDQPEFVAEIVESCRVCHPLTELRIIRHEPDNRFLECALAANADYIITVNTSRGHFDQKQFQTVRVVTPREFLNLRSVVRLVQKLIEG